VVKKQIAASSGAAIAPTVIRNLGSAARDKRTDKVFLHTYGSWGSQRTCEIPAPMFDFVTPVRGGMSLR